MTGTIVVGIDGSEASRRAVEWAGARAEKRGGSVELVCVVDHIFGSPIYGPHYEPTRNAELALEHAEKHLGELAPTVTVSTAVAHGSVAAQLLELSRTAGLVVIGTDRSFRDTGPRFGTLPLKLASGSRCPVAVIPWTGAEHREGVVVGVDGSQAARVALRSALMEASLAAEPLTVVHAWPTPPSYRKDEKGSWTPSDEFLKVQKRVVSQALADVGAEANGVTIRSLVAQGVAAEVLTDAGRTARLVMVGSHGKGAIESVLLGSVSHDVLVNISAPTLVIPSTYAMAGPRLDRYEVEAWA